MDTTHADAQAALPTDMVESTDLHVDVVSINGTKLMNGTTSGHRSNETIDFMPILADWAHGRNLPSFKSVFAMLAFALHLVVDFFLDYFLWKVVFTLVAVEAPQIVVPAPWTDKKRDDEDEVPQIQQERSITKSLRTTTRHLYSVGGIFAVCRGMALHIAFYVGAITASAPVFIFWAARRLGAEEDDTASDRDLTLYEQIKDIAGETTFEIGTSLIFCSWLAAWVHIVITQHTLRIWYRRLPPFLSTFYATWRPLVLIPLVSILIRRTTIIILKRSLGLGGGSNSNESVFMSRNMLLTLIWVVVQGLDLLAILPLELAMVRIQASLLPEDEEPIVPFDRSFGTSSNGLRPGLLAEPRGPLSFRQAWRSLTWIEMRRLVKIFVKMLLVEVVVKSVFWLAVGNNVWPNNWVPTRVTWD